MIDKKLIILASAGIIIVIISFLISHFFTGKDQNQTTPSPSSNLDTTQAITPIEETIFFPNFISSQDSIYYLGNQGIKLKKYSLQDQKTEILYDDDIYFVQNMKISPDGQKALILIKDNEDYIFKILDIQQKNLIDFQKNAFDAEWLNNNQIVFSNTNDDKSELAITSNYGQDSQKLIDLPFSLPIISLSPDTKKAIVYPEPEGFGQNPLYLFSFDTNKLEQLSEEYNLVGARWSPDSKNIISPELDQNGDSASLVITNLENSKQQTVALKTDLDKIIWTDNDNIFAAVPKDSQNDQLYLINAKTGSSTSLQYSFSNPYNSSALDIHNLMLNNKTLYFTSDDILYSLFLP